MPTRREHKEEDDADDIEEMSDDSRRSTTRVLRRCWETRGERRLTGSVGRPKGRLKRDEG